MFGELLEDLQRERRELQTRQQVAFSLGIVARLVWKGALWVGLFFLIGAFMITKTILYMALGGKGWR